MFGLGGFHGARKEKERRKKNILGGIHIWTVERHIFEGINIWSVIHSWRDTHLEGYKF